MVKHHEAQCGGRSRLSYATIIGCCERLEAHHLHIIGDGEEECCVGIGRESALVGLSQHLHGTTMVYVLILIDAVEVGCRIGACEILACELHLTAVGKHEGGVYPVAMVVVVVVAAVVHHENQLFASFWPFDVDLYGVSVSSVGYRLAAVECLAAYDPTCGGAVEECQVAVSCGGVDASPHGVSVVLVGRYLMCLHAIFMHLMILLVGEQ